MRKGALTTEEAKRIKDALDVCHAAISHLTMTLADIEASVAESKRGDFDTAETVETLSRLLDKLILVPVMAEFRHLRINNNISY